MSVKGNKNFCFARVIFNFQIEKVNRKDTREGACG